MHLFKIELGAKLHGGFDFLQFILILESSKINSKNIASRPIEPALSIFTYRIFEEYRRDGFSSLDLILAWWRAMKILLFGAVDDLIWRRYSPFSRYFQSGIARHVQLSRNLSRTCITARGRFDRKQFWITFCIIGIRNLIFCDLITVF